MKNILAKLGSKKVMGAVLVMVTLVVGLGVISNFSDGSQRAANDAALAKFSDDAYNGNNFFNRGASRTDLERQMTAQQDKNTARFLRGKSEGIDEDDAFSSDGAYAEGVRSDEGFVYGEGASAAGVAGSGANGAYGPNNTMYAQGGGVDENGVPYGAAGANGEYSANGEFDENGVPIGANGVRNGAGGVAADGAAENSAEDADSAEAKARKSKQARDRANKLRRATQLNRLAASNGGTSWGAASGGNMGGGAAMGGSNTGSEKTSRALPSTEAAQANNADIKGFRLGRGGAIGGYNFANAGGKADNAGTESGKVFR